MPQLWNRFVPMRASATACRRWLVGPKRAVNAISHSHRSSSSTTQGLQQRVIIETPQDHQIEHTNLPLWQGDGSADKKSSYRQGLIDWWCGLLIGVESFGHKPSNISVPINSAAGHEIIGAFSTIRDEGTDVDQAAVYIPGAPPRWRTPPLGFTMPVRSPQPLGAEETGSSSEISQRRPLRFRHPSRVDKYLWKVPVRAVEAMSGTDALADIDVMITAKRLDGFWKFCSGASSMEMAANATLVGNTLFIDGFQPVGLELGSELDKPNRFAVCGNSWPQKYADSLQHFHIVRYRLGGLNLAVVANVDTTIEWPAKDESCLVDLPASVVTFSNEFPRNWANWGGMYQHWLRRCPSLIACLHEQGRFTYQRVERQDVYWKEWESFRVNQSCLQKLVSVFQRLRVLLKEAAPGQSCIVKKISTTQRQPDDIKWLNQRRLSGIRGTPKLAVCLATHGMHPLPTYEA